LKLKPGLSWVFTHSVIGQLESLNDLLQSGSLLDLKLMQLKDQNSELAGTDGLYFADMAVAELKVLGLTFTNLHEIIKMVKDEYLIYTVWDNVNTDLDSHITSLRNALDALNILNTLKANNKSKVIEHTITASKLSRDSLLERKIYDWRADLSGDSKLDFNGNNIYEKFDPEAPEHETEHEQLNMRQGANASIPNLRDTKGISSHTASAARHRKPRITKSKKNSQSSGSYKRDTLSYTSFELSDFSASEPSIVEPSWNELGKRWDMALSDRELPPSPPQVRNIETNSRLTSRVRIGDKSKFSEIIGPDLPNGDGGNLQGDKFFGHFPFQRVLKDTPGEREFEIGDEFYREFPRDNW